MTVSSDVETRFPTSGNDSTSGDRTFSHAAGASAKGAIVIVEHVSNADGVTGVLYGGTAMSKQATADDTSEATRVTVWFLGDLTGLGATQTVTLQGCSTNEKVACCCTVLAGTATTEINATNTINTTTSANPSISLTTTKATMAYGGLVTGAAAPATTPATGCTDLSTGPDFGQHAGNFERRTSEDAAGTVTLGYTLGSDDWAFAAIAVAEVAAAATGTPILVMAPPRAS